MSLLEVFAIAVGLAMDTFAVAIATSISLGKVSGRQLFRFSWHFGLFQAMMPLFGWALGQSVDQYISAWDHWLAFVLLSYVGGKAIWGAYKDDGETGAPKSDPTRGASLVMLSIATSIDAFAVGLSFAFLEMTIWRPIAIIGVVTALITFSGMLMGSKLGSKLGKNVEIIGGLILVGIGLKILIQHLA